MEETEEMYLSRINKEERKLELLLRIAKSLEEIAKKIQKED